MDDGLAASQAICSISSSNICCFGVSKPSPFIFFDWSFSCFLLLNLPKAKIYMGDSGIFKPSSVLLSCEIDSIWCWLILLGWFIVDATSTAVVRLR